MVCITLKSFIRACAPVSGGISDLVIFDPDDFTWTQAAPVAGVKQPYTAVARQAGATSPNGVFFIVNFQAEEAEWTWKQTVKGCSVKYEHAFNFQLPENGQTLTNFLEALDAAACCCQLGIVLRLNTGKILVAGEKFVNAAAIPKFRMLNSGSSGTSGKLLDDFNGGNLIITGPYSRNLYEYTGAWSTITALEV